MSDGRILVAADSPESAAHLSNLLTVAGYEVFPADASAAPPECDIVVADITTRFSPYAGIQAQRRMGCSAPAIVFATRITDQMATEAFGLNIRDFVLRPVDDDVILQRIGAFLEAMRWEMSSISQTQPSEIAQTTDGQINRRLEEMNMLSRIGRAIAALSDLDEMLAHVVDAAVFLSKAEEGAIFLLNEYGALVLGAEKGFGAQQAESIQRPSKDSDAMEVMRTGMPIMQDADNEHKLTTGFLVRALINVPIIIGQHTAGVLAVYNHGARSFEGSDLAILTNLADYAAMAIDKVRSLQHVEQQMRDALGASREVVLHAETLIAPVQGIESLADTLLQGDFGQLNEQQHTAVRRIKQATARLNEVVELINQAAAGASALRTK